MRVLVTGHLGYVGTILVPMLLEHGHEVFGLDSDLFRRCTFLPGRIRAVLGAEKDVRDVEEGDLRGFEAVLHLAALSNDPLGDLDPEVTMEINHRASVRLATLARRAGVERFVFSSSCSNYGAAGDDWLTEESPFNPVTPYGIAKVRAESEIAPLATPDFTPVLLRSATAFGVSPRLRFDLAVNNLVAWALTTGRIFLKSDGSAWRPFVHVSDMARAFVAVLEAPAAKVRGEAFNVGSTPENLRIREVAAIVGEVVPDCKVEFAEGASPDKRCYRVNCDKLPRALPAYRAEWSVRRGVEELYATYRAQGLSLAEFEGPAFQRVAHVKKLLAEGVLDPTLRHARRDPAKATG